MITIDGDFPTGAKCKHHCSPTCHPGQTDEKEWLYGCLHNAWPQNKAGDFCPLVRCGGDPAKCEIPIKLLLRTINGQRARLRNAERKMEAAQQNIDELKVLINARRGE